MCLASCFFLVLPHILACTCVSLFSLTSSFFPLLSLSSLSLSESARAGNQHLSGSFILTTDLEVVHTSIAVTAVNGHLIFSPSSLKFGEVFPGLLESRPLSVTSKYTVPVTVTDLTSDDPRVVTSITNTVLHPGVEVRCMVMSACVCLKVCRACLPLLLHGHIFSCLLFSPYQTEVGTVTLDLSRGSHEEDYLYFGANTLTMSSIEELQTTGELQETADW